MSNFAQVEQRLSELENRLAALEEETASEMTARTKQNSDARGRKPSEEKSKAAQ